MALNPQILSNALDRGFARNRQKRLDAELRDDRQFQRQRQMQADQRQDEIYQRNVADYEQKKADEQALRDISQIEYRLGSMIAGKPLPPDDGSFDAALARMIGRGAQKYAADDRPRRFVGLLPAPGNRFAAELEITNPDGTTYRAPMTMNGSSDPSDPVKTWSLNDMHLEALREKAALMRIAHGDMSPLTRRQEAAKLKAQYDREDRLTKEKRNWEMKKLGLQHRFKLDEMGTEYGYKGRLEAAKRKGEAKSKNPWDEKKISDAIRKGMFQMHGLEFGVDPNTPQSLQAIEDSNRATAIALDKFRRGEDFNINQIMADVYGGRVKQNQYTAKRNELTAMGIPGAGTFWDNDEKIIEAVNQAFPPDADPREVERFLRDRGIDEDSRRRVHRARKRLGAASSVRGVTAAGSVPRFQPGQTAQKIAPGDVAAMREAIAAGKRAIAAGADSREVMQRLHALGVDFDALSPRKKPQETGRRPVVPKVAPRPEELPFPVDERKFKELVDGDIVRTWAKQGFPVKAWIDEVTMNLGPRERKMGARLKASLANDGLLR